MESMITARDAQTIAALMDERDALKSQRDELCVTARSVVADSRLSKVPVDPHDEPARVSITYMSFLALCAAIARAEKGGAK